jgi:hypothetical protein
LLDGQCVPAIGRTIKVYKPMADSAGWCPIDNFWAYWAMKHREYWHIYVIHSLLWYCKITT